MVGQKRLLDEFSLKTLDTLDHSNLIIAPKGSGKHTLVNEIASMFKIEVDDITSLIDLDTIQLIETSPLIKFYIIDVNQITTKEQNMILKLVEEPASNVFLFLLCTSESFVIPTIYNRCIPYTLDRYSIEELKNFTDDETLLSFFDTPGLIEKSKRQKINDIIKLVHNFIENAKRANYSNLLTISNKINFSGDDNLFDLDIFLEILINEVANIIIYDRNNNLIPLFNLVKKCRYNINVPKVNKKFVFEKFLIETKEL